MAGTTPSATELCRLAKEHGVNRVAYSVFGNTVNVSIPISKKDMDTDISQLNLSVRAYNGLKRNGVSAIRDLVKIIETGELTSIRNLGRISISQIKTALMDYCYNQLDNNEKTAFFQNIINTNR